MANILVVDDDKALRGLLCEFLSAQGHAASEACDGRIALQQIRRDRPDLVLTDLVMPDVEGIEMIMALRRESPQLKIIAMSGDSLVSSPGLKAAELLGAHWTLAKPFSLAELAKIVATLLRSRP